MRVGIIGLLHESNTFAAQPTTLADFQDNVLAVGSDVRSVFDGTHHEIGGFLEALDRLRVRSVPVFAARALPSGTICAATWRELIDRMLQALTAAGPLDGLLVAPHGATVSEEFADADGHWLAAVRRQLGPDIPIIGTIDAHANLSQQMVDQTDALIGYRSNPHLDQRQRGIDAAEMIARTIRGEIRPQMAAVFPPLAISIDRQMTSEPPLASHFESLNRLLQQPAILSGSIVLGFPYADVAEMGSATIVVADADSSVAQHEAQQLAQQLWSDRHDFVQSLPNAEEAMLRLADLSPPVCLLDMGDNVGGGSSADGTALLAAMVRHRIRNAFICLCDPQAVCQAEQAGTDAWGAVFTGRSCRSTAR